MKVYGHPLSNCTRKVLVTLAEKGSEPELVPVDLFAGEHKAAAHLARHPFGVIPVLDDDGFVLFESRAIIRYLDARCEGPRLTPQSVREVARMDQWLSVDQSYIAPHVGTLVRERIVKPHAGQPADPAAERAAEAALASALGIVDQELGKHAYLSGEAFTLADISLMPYVASLGTLRAEHLLADLPRLQRWWHAVRQRPSWLRVTGS